MRLHNVISVVDDDLQKYLKVSKTYLKLSKIKIKRTKIGKMLGIYLSEQKKKIDNKS
jgi:hypothetical protein